MKNRPELTRFVQRWTLPLLGAVALLWFLCRVIPKPSRAAYPCMRASFPLASGFVLWLISLFGLRLAWRRLGANLVSRRPLLAGCTAVAGILVGTLWVASQPASDALAAVNDGHAPVGEGKGIFPGRVVWLHAPDATDWAGKDAGDHWAEPVHTHEPTVARMMDEAILSLGGGSTVGTSWDAMFRHFNEQRGKGEVGYQPGEKIMIKINLTLTNATMGSLDSSYNKVKSGWFGTIWNNTEVAPQSIIALLRQLVYEAGVEESDIYIGDPVCLFPNYLWNLIHPEFPDVNYVENRGALGRYRTEFSDVQFHWSHDDAKGKREDYLPDSYADAAYLINFAIPKSHGYGGFTACAKNHYGSFIRTPVGNLRDFGDLDYFNLHESLPDSSVGVPGSAQYRSLVDITGHPDLGGKTILYLLDFLYSGHTWSGDPEKWSMQPFNGDWPSSILASMDPIAIDSVAYDFLAEEWPDEVLATSLGQDGAQDYLHEAAMADAPPSGVFYDPAGDGSGLQSLGVHEHWNNPLQKQYSRNLGFNHGIELVQLQINQAVAQPALHATADLKGNQLVLHVVHKDPADTYVLEQVNLATGAKITVQTLPAGSYGQRVDLPAPVSSSNAFYRVRPQ